MATCPGRFGNTMIRRFRGAIRSPRSRTVTDGWWAGPTLRRPARSLTVAVLIRALALLSGSATASAQSGGDYVITKGAIAGGGGTATGGDYVMSGTIGQHDADEPLSGGDYELSGGFWAGVDPTVLDPPGVGDDQCYSGTTPTGTPCSVNGDCPGGQLCGLKSRFITVKPALSAGGDVSIKVTVVDNPLDPSTVGQSWFAGPQASAGNAPAPPVQVAQLECTATPHSSSSWTTGDLHIYGTVIVPGAGYEVAMCDVGGSPCSVGLEVATGRWGDVVASYNVVDFSDVSALVSKFSAGVGSIDLPRADLIGSLQMDGSDLLNLNINFADISQAIGAFGGASYGAAVSACP